MKLNSFQGNTGRNGDDCHSVAEQIFSEEGLEWEPYNEVDSIENLIKELDPQKTI